MHAKQDIAVIVVDLVCEQEHRFEGWFASSEALDQQRESGLLTCPVCGSHKVSRLPSAPHVAARSSDDAPDMPANTQQPDVAGLAAQLIRALQSQAAQSEDVGERFPEEARRIHHGDAEERAIRGQASLREVMELWEEGVSVLPVPPAKEDLH